MSAVLVLATRNEHKVGELRSILAPLLPDVDPAGIVSAAAFDVPEPVEDEITFAGNALIKARQLAKATGLPAVADDSGICVDALGGAPGIFSARWCGHHGDDAANLDLLLGQLSDVPDRHRGAQFACAAVLVMPDGREWVREGRMKGTLVRERRGQSGFGYDPIFLADGQELTNGELDAEVKNQISHRFIAFKELAPIIAEQLSRA